MTTLGEQLAHSYAQHPNFQFDQQPLRLDAELLSAFNDAYALLRAYGSRFTAAQFLRSREACSARLAAVFAALGGQAAEPYETQFLHELSAECARLLAEELEVFRTRPLPRAIALRGARSPDDAVKLLKSRFYFGLLSREAVQQILAIGAEDLSAFRRSAAQGNTTRDVLSVNVGSTVRSILPILNREFRRQGVLDAVSVYMDRRMLVTGAALELSVPQATWWANSFEGLSRAPSSLYAHLDESIACPKSIVYLSDVERGTGATSCYAGAYEALSLNPLQDIVGRVVGNVGGGADSPLRVYYARRYHQTMSSEAFRRHFMRLPPEIRFNSHFGWDVLPDSEAERSLLEREHYMVGRAGTYLIFDGAHLLHRGGMLERGERIALQVVFSGVSTLQRIARRVRRALP
ncbi:MAG TPA: hypothetical protein VGP20_11650 [Steroidobacteraceae bacterium]|jgi:hypothetical protein|nr:hypothetical protein [Steroidobacteraceae bacterium]